MEAVEGELLAERLSGFLSKFSNLQLTDHIRAGLSGIDDVSLDFAWFDAVINGLLASPMFGMDTGVDDKAARPKQFRLELSETSLQTPLVPAGLGRKPLRIESPTFDQRRNIAERANLPESRKGRIFDL